TATTLVRFEQRNIAEHLCCLIIRIHYGSIVPEAELLGGPQKISAVAGGHGQAYNAPDSRADRAIERQRLITGHYLVLFLWATIKTLFPYPRRVFCCACFSSASAASAMLSKRSATIRPRAPMRPHWGRRPIRVKAHGSVLHAMLRVGLAPAGRSAGEERL